METTTVLLIAIPVLVVLAGVLLFAAARRRDTGEAIGLMSRETTKRDRGSVVPSGAEATVTTGRQVERSAALERREASQALATPAPAAPVVWTPPDPDVLAVTRRQFFNRSTVAFMGIGIAAFGGSVLAFLWPQVTGGFGSAINIGTTARVDGDITDGQGFAYYPEGRMWVTRYPSEGLPRARTVYEGGVLEGMEAGYVALFQTCPHLGCRVPECTTSQWFECPCHGSQYNRVGEWKGGPAPRGMDRFPVALSGNTLVVDTGTLIQGPPLGTNTTGQEAEGPNCLAAG